MKIYLKPQTSEQHIMIDTSMMQASPNFDGNTGLTKGSSRTQNTSDQRVKERDVWSEGYWE
ncbi:MAG: hypothetical protein II750_09185 [Bacteroidaceae bacterium]|nr:hypothetical protein [Bacteroidaceae bacterium]